jgi:hypothetical protein
MSMTGRRRTSIITEFKAYLFDDAKRRRRPVIVDLGGMSPDSTPHAMVKRKQAT